MKHTLPTDTERLVNLAAQANFEYEDAYYIWAQVYQRQDAYQFVETVLYIARVHRLPVCLAFVAYQLQPGWYPEYELADWVTA